MKKRNFSPETLLFFLHFFVNILGIETSCDETAAAIVENGTKVHSNVIESSVQFHEKTGGIIPEIAARDAEKKILSAISSTLKEANMSLKNIDALAVTAGPGLMGSLLVGIEAARTLAFIHKKPLIPVHHISGHICANRLEEEQKPNFPILVLTVSGGHNELVLWRDNFIFETIGGTLDDAAGEAFDKAARMLELGFPGGPAIEKMAHTGDKKKYPFPRPMRNVEGFDFSFSGLKTALLYAIQKNENLEKNRADFAASFQAAVVESLFLRLKKAACSFSVREIHLSGGVSANHSLRKCVQDFCAHNKLVFRVPHLKLCTDNAAMIASAAFWKNASFSEKWDWKTVQPVLTRKFF